MTIAAASETWSILDRVKDRAEALTPQISSSDRLRLDEYLGSVGEMETRVDAMRKNLEKAQDVAKGQNRPVFTMERPANGMPEDLRDHTRLMCDIIATAFQTDRTRVASLILARDLWHATTPSSMCVLGTTRLLTTISPTVTNGSRGSI